jgi:hypothetical protein
MRYSPEKEIPSDKKRYSVAIHGCMAIRSVRQIVRTPHRGNQQTEQQKEWLLEHSGKY